MKKSDDHLKTVNNYIVYVKLNLKDANNDRL